MQINPHFDLGVAGEQHAGWQAAHDAAARGDQLGFEQGFEPARTRGEMACRRQRFAFGARRVRGLGLTGWGFQICFLENLKGLQFDQQHHEHQHNDRYFIEPAEPHVAFTALSCVKLAQQTFADVMITDQRDDQCEFRP